MKTYLMLLVLCMGTVTFAACMTPRQTDAVLTIRQMERDGVVDSETADRLVEALNPRTMLDDIMLMLGGMLGGTAGGSILTNYQRNRKRRQLGEPVRPEDVNPVSP